jgi:hypothetical protein
VRGPPDYIVTIGLVNQMTPLWCGTAPIRSVARPLLLWKVVSKETAFGGCEHHTNGTRVDEEDRVPTNALARGLRRAEQGR